MKKYLHLSFLLVFSILSLSVNAQIYCTSMAGNSSDEEILNVTVGSWNNPSECFTTGGAGSILNQYSDFTTTVAAANLIQGQSVPFSIAIGTCGGNYPSGTAIFIDYNQNGFFEEPNERVFGTDGTTNGPHTLSGNVIVPPTASVGITRMRIINAEGYPGIGITSCLNYSYGETEDYSVFIDEAPPCSGTPIPGNTLSSHSTVCSDVYFTLSLQNNIVENGISYQWQSSADSVIWTDIPGAASTSLITLQTVPTYYRCTVTCGPNTGWSNSTYVAMNAANSCYCVPPLSNYPCSPMWITSVITSGGVSDFNSTSDCNGSTYSDFSSSQIASNVQLGTTSITFSSFDYAMAFSVWIDFNDNGIFDPSEQVIANNNPIGALFFTDSIMVPLTANPGTHRMRVRGDYNYYGAPADPCNQLQYGETEDYSFTVIPLVPTYCTPIPSGDPCTYMWITNVTTSGGISDFSNSSDCSDSSYTDFSVSNIASNFQLANTTLSFTSYSYALSYSVWIDFNNDGIFDPSEQVVADLNSGAALTVSYNFTVPASATPGAHKMRVRGQYLYNGGIPTDPCSQFYYGETEDYTFTVIANVPCQGTPNPGNISSSQSSVCAGVDFTLSLQNNSLATGITYQWQSSPDNAGWSDISGATSTTLTTSQAFSSFYRCAVMCAFSSTTATSDPLLVAMNSVTSCYCIPPSSTYSQYGEMWISNVATNGGISDFNNSTGFVGSSYNDFSDSSNVSNSQLASTMMSFTSGGNPMAYSVWIDFDDNGIFEVAERVIALENPSNNLTITANFIVPVSAAPGTHRMRVRGDYFWNGAPVDPCNQLEYGETEDYAFTVLAMNQCVPPPSISACTDMWITEVSTSGGVSDFTNSSGCAISSYTYYGNFKNASNRQLGVTSMTFSSFNTLQSVCYPMAFSVWIDYNGNDIFENSEQVIANNNTGQLLTLTDKFQVPMFATPGTYRMRVRAEYTGISAAPADPCSQLYYGDTEDYLFTVLPTVFVNQIIVSGDAGATFIDTEAGTLQMYATVLPPDADNLSVRWDVADGTGRASISADGILTALVNGTVMVTATAKDGTFISSSMELNISNQDVTPDDLNIIKDGGFATEGSLSLTSSPWTAWSLNGGSAYVGSGACTMVPASIGQIWELQVAQGDWVVSNGKSYTLTFTAWADADRTFNISMEDPNNSWTRLGLSSDPNALGGRSEWSIPVTTTPTTFTYHTTIDAVQFNTQFKFVISTSNDMPAVYIDNISLVNEVFEPASITIQPLANGGLWNSGSQQNIEYTTVNINQIVILEYSSDGGNFWSTIGSVIPVKGYNSYLWTVPNGDGSQNSMLRVITEDGSVSGTSNLFAITSALNMNSDPVTTCSGSFYDSGGEFGGYNTYESFVKVITPATPGNKISVSFSSFDTEPGYDYLYVYDGPDTSYPEVPGSPFTGNVSIGTITASAPNSSGALTFQFISDGSVQYSGWAASVSCVAGPVSPTIYTMPVTSFTETTAIFDADVTDDGGDPITSKGVCWNKTGSPTTANVRIEDGSGLGPYTSNVSKLLGNTTYYVRAFAINTLGTFYGNEVSFTTSMPDPALQVFSLTGNAFYQSDGVTPSYWGYDIDLTYDGTAGTVSTYKTNNHLTILQNGEFKVRRNHDWVDPAYGYDELTIIDDAANFEKDVYTGYGNIKTLTTKLYMVYLMVDWSNNAVSLKFTALSPTFNTTAVDAVYSNAADLSAEVTNEGFTPVTQYGVCWSTSPDPNLDFGFYTSDGSGTGAYTSGIAGLNPGTTYYVRAYTICNLGVFYGNELGFTTLSSDAFITSSVFNVDQNAQTISSIALSETLASFKANLTPAAGATFEVFESDGLTVAADLQTGYMVIVTAQDGISTFGYNITVNSTLSSDALFTYFKFPGTIATVDPVTYSVSATVPYGYDVTNLAPEFGLSSGATASIGGIIQVSGLANIDFTNNVVYDITAEDGTTVISWNVTITVAPPSTDASLSSLVYSIDNSALTIYNVPVGETKATFLNNLIHDPYAYIDIFKSDWSDAYDVQPGYLVYVEAQDYYYYNIYTIVNSQADMISFSIAGNPATINPAAYQVDVTVPFGTDVTNLIPGFTISGGAAAYINGVEQFSDLSSVDFTNPVYYDVFAEDWNTVFSWLVTVSVAPPSSDATLSSLAYAVNNIAETITNVPFTEVLGNFTANLTPAANASLIVVETDASTPATDLQTGYFVVVTAQNGSTKNFAITKNTSISSEANFTSFSFAGYSANINTLSLEVTATLPYGFDLTNVVPYFTLSTAATASIGGFVVGSGAFSYDFSSPVVFDITAEDGTIAYWTVNLSVTPGSNDATLSSGTYTVDNNTSKITNIPGTESLSVFKSNLTPAANASFEVYLSDGATVAGDLQSGYLAIVTAQDGTVKTYTIILNAVGSNLAKMLAFKISGINGTISQADNTVTLTLPYGSDTNNLVAIFSISSGASVQVGAITQVSGVSSNNFTDPVIYTITSENGVVVVEWMVTIAVTPPSNNATVSSAVYTVNNTAGTIYNIPNNESLTTFINNLTPAPGGSFMVYQSDGFTIATDLQTGYMVIGKAQDINTIKVYTIASSAANIITYSIAGVNANVNSTTLKVTATLPFGTDVTDLKASFSISDGASAKVGGSTQVTGVSSNNFTSPVVYDITAQDGSTVISWNVVLTVTPGSTDASLSSVVYTINNSAGTILNVPGSETLFNFKNNLTPASGATFEVYHGDGTTIASDLQSGYKVIVTAQDGTTKKTYTIASSAADFIAYSVSGKNASINTINRTVNVSLPFGTNVSNLVATFSISNGASVKIGNVTQVSGVTGNSFTIPVDYKITAEDGTTNAIWKVTISLTAASTDATVSSVVYNVNNADKTITNVPVTENLALFQSNITPANGATFKVFQSDGITDATDVQTGYKLIGIAEDNASSITYTITKNSVQSSDANFITFKIAGYDANVSAPGTYTVTATVPFGTSVSNLAATFSYSLGVSSVKVGGVSQSSGVTTNNFTNPVVYALTAEDGSVLNWTVTITVTAPSADATVSSVAFDVDNSTETISNVPFNETLALFKGKLTPATFASFNVYLGDGTTIATDLQTGYKVIVTAQDVNVKKTYIISISSAGVASSNSTICSGTNASMTLAGYTGTIQWQQSADGFTDWSNVSSGSGSATASYSTGYLAATTYYRAAVTDITVSYSNVITVSVTQMPVGATTISGSAAICTDQSVTYSLAAIDNASSYIWTLPTNASGTSTSNSIDVTFNSSFTSGGIEVFGQNECGDGEAAIIIVSVNPLAGGAGTISGSSAVCQGQSSVTYTVPDIANASSYIWTLPIGASGTSTTNSINVDFSTSAVSGNISVKGNNICGNGTASNLAITVGQLPANPGTINGAASVCQGENSKSYAVPSISRATSYVWTLPGGATGTSTSNFISVNYDLTAVSGDIIVRGNNSCGNGAPRALPITVNPLPTAAGTITGPGAICQGQSTGTYTVDAVPNATSYVWSLPTGVTGTSSTNTIDVNFAGSFVSGAIEVYGHNSCGNGESSIIGITVNPIPAKPVITVSGSTTFCDGGSVDLSAPTSASYLWSTGAITKTITVSITGSYTVQVSNGTCQSVVSDAVNVTVNSLPSKPVITASGSTVFCEGGSVDLSAPVSASYLWSTGAITQNITVSLAGSITVQVGNDNCLSISSDPVDITVNPFPSSAGAISGTTAICSVPGLGTYTVPDIANATSYIWTLPGGTSGISTTSNINVSFDASFTSGNITVRGANSCGSGNESILAISLTAPLANADAISGPATVCKGSNGVTYTVPVITDATSYVWTIPNTDVTGASTTNSINLDFSASFVSGDIKVQGQNACSIGGESLITVTANPQTADAGLISGSATVCQGESSVTYAVPDIANATSYEWTLPAGATETSTSNSITVDYSSSAVSGNLTVKGNGTCGFGSASSMAVVVNPLPGIAGSITGTLTVCQGVSNVLYTAVPISGADSYIWTLPSGAAGSSATNAITVNYNTSAVSGNITWKGHNSCGDGPAGTLAVTVDPLPASAGTISGKSTICEGPISETYTVPAITNATSYQWTLPDGATGTSTTNSISVSFASGFVAGDIDVYGVNSCGNGGSSTFAVTVMLKPATAGVIAGPGAACVGEMVTYTVPPVANATSYIWTLPVAGVTGTSLTNSIDINFVSAFTTDQIEVYGKNTCYDGTASSLLIKSNQVPGNAGAITGLTTVCLNQNSVSYSVSTISSADSYVWSLPTGATGTLVGVGKIINVDFGPTAVSGTISVKGHNSCDGLQSSTDVTVKAPYEGEQICLVTIDTATGKNMVVWEKTKDVDIASYNIYRETDVGNVYSFVENVLVDSLSVYVDMTSNPAKFAHKYYISAVDNCGNESGESDWHKTMLLTSSLGTDESSINLAWTEYKKGKRGELGNSFLFTSYIIYRSTDTTKMNAIATLPSDNTLYVDNTAPKGVNLYYRIAGVKADPCDPADLLGKKASSGPFVHSLSNLEDNRLQGTGITNPLAEALELSVYPSPFTDLTNISYTLEKETKMKVEVYNVVGGKIKVLLDENQSSGYHKLEMKAADVNYQPGVYYIKIYVNGEVVIRKTMLTR